MKILKFSAISSTNDYLKELISKSSIENYTVISTDFQSKGKGQAANKWVSSKGKNLLFSILVRFSNYEIAKQAYINFAISIGIYQVLKKYYPKIDIKWPNDIMAEDKKICGILIENTVKGNKLSYSIIGIGLNVNQLEFSKDLPNAISLKALKNRDIDRDILLIELLESIKQQIKILNEKSLDGLKFNYEKALFKKGITMMFKTNKNKTFLGKIKGVSEIGLLQIELEDGVVVEFANKEVFFI